MVVLDEPSSAIDPDSEYEMLMQIINTCEKKTLAIISHKMSMCVKADKVLYFEKGRILEQGTHSELLRNKKGYSRLYHEQKKWYE